MVEGDPNNNTWIVHKDGEMTNIQKLVTKLAMSPNVTVFCLLDCCRNVVQSKGKFKSEPLKGELWIGFGAGEGKVATAPKGGMSRYTSDFLALV